VETAAGLIFIIPVLFILIDIAALVMSQTANDSLAKQCARAAADQPSGSPTSPQQTQAAQNAYNKYQDNSMVKKVNLTVLDNGDGTITARTWILCTLPIPVPFGGPATQQFEAFSTEPVVGQLP